MNVGPKCHIPELSPPGPLLKRCRGDCVYVYTVGCVMLSSGALVKSYWAELEDKYTNPTDRKDTLEHLASVTLAATCGR